MTPPETLPSYLCHVCQAGAAAEHVRAVVSEPVIEITDDGSIGPLHDIDASRPDARIAFWTELLCYSGLHPDFNPAIHIAMARRQLMHFLQHRGALVIWSASHITEQILRRRLHWWLRDTPVSIIEIRVPCFAVSTAAGTSIDMLDAAILREALDRAVLIRDSERARLAQEWVALREQGEGLRIWDDGHLVGRPADHLDRQLLELASHAPVLLPRLVSNAAETTGYSEVFWRWRARKLVALGCLKLVEDTWNNNRNPKAESLNSYICNSASLS